MSLSSRASFLWLAAGFVLTVLLRIGPAREAGLWVDEAYTVLTSSLPWSDLTAQLRADDAPPLYYVLQKLVLGAFGSSELAARGLSLASSVGTLFLGWHWFRRSLPRGLPFFVLAWSTSTLSIFYAQQARSYAWIHFLVLVAMFVWSRIVSGIATSGPGGKASGGTADSSGSEPGSGLGSGLGSESGSGLGSGLGSESGSESGSGSGSPRPWLIVGLGFALLALLYTHNLSVWMVASFTVLALIRLRPGKAAGTLVAVVVVGAVPWLLQVVSQLGVHRELNAWMGGWWESRPAAMGPLYSFGVFSNGTAPWIRPPVPLPGMETKWQLAAILVWVAVAAGLLGSLRPLWRSKTNSEGGPGGTNDRGAGVAAVDEPVIVRTAWILVLAAFAGLALTYWISGPAYVLGRTDTFAFLPFVVLLAVGWSKLPKRLGWICLAVWVLAGLATATRPPANPKGSDRAVAEWLADHLENGEPVVVPALGRPSLEYYARRQGWWDKSGGVRAFPILLDENPAAVFPTPLESLSEYESEAKELRATWEAAGAKTVYIVAIPTAEAEASPPPPRASLEVKAGETLTANDLRYPMSVLVYTLVGLEPVDLEARYLQDWVGGQRALLSIPRKSWIDPEELRKIETSP